VADRQPSEDVVRATLNQWRDQSGLEKVADLLPVVIAADITGPQFKRSPRYWSTAGSLGAGGAGIQSVAGVRCVEGILTIDRMYGVSTVGVNVHLKIDRKSSALNYNQSAICFLLNGDRPNGVNISVATCRRMLQNNAVSPAGDIFWAQDTEMDLDWHDRPIVLFPEDRLYLNPQQTNQPIDFAMAGREYEV